MGKPSRRPNLLLLMTDQQRADYAANITLIDDQIGRILDTISARGELDNTVIIFASDHGEMNGDCGLIYKSTFLDGAVRVPLLIRTPDMVGHGRSGQLCASPVEWIDIGPTLVDLAGATMAHNQFGRSLQPTFSDPDVQHRPDALSEIRGEVMLLTEKWKVAVNDAGRVYLLFDIHNDPTETENLAGRPGAAGIESQLRQRILERIVQSQLRIELQRAPV